MPSPGLPGTFDSGPAPFTDGGDWDIVKRALKSEANAREILRKFHVHRC
jgi:hypothetical protein